MLKNFFNSTKLSGSENGMIWERVGVGGEHNHNNLYETVKK